MEVYQTMPKNCKDAKQKLAYSSRKANTAYKHLCLDFNFKSIKFILDYEQVGTGQLRSCWFYNDNGPYMDINKATLILIKAGLIGSNQVNLLDIDKLDSKATDIAVEWIDKIGSLAVLHNYIIEQLEDKHFFTSSAELEMIMQSTQSQSSKKRVQEMMTTVKRDRQYIQKLIGITYLSETD